ncbi:MAG: DUF2924 domain-containing protein [Deltaproteobacteria bacterium]|nr:MAG: DUF2924 domain-containing protein [Deltaproteobacteria bacterium]
MTTKKQNATVKKASKSADGKTWVIPEAKPKPAKKGSGKKAQVATKTPVEKKNGKRTPALASLKVAPKELVVTYKGTEHKAKVNEDGTITVNNKTFNSPSRAGKEVTGREVDGWTFWSYEVPGNGLKKLNMLRKVGN